MITAQGIVGGRGGGDISAKLFLPRSDKKKEHRTSNVQHPILNGKDEHKAYDLEERLIDCPLQIIKIVEQLPNKCNV
jgi:hypothetical protein